MGRNSGQVFGASGRKDLLLFEPSQLTLVTDKANALYDERVELEVDERLIKNIMVFGVLEPIIVRLNGEDKKGQPIVEVIDGRQRVKATIEANRRLAKQGSETHRVPAVTRRGDDASMAGIMVSANELRTPDDPISRARKMQTLIDMGKSPEEVGVYFGVSAHTVSNGLTLLDCAAPVQEAIAKGEVSQVVGRTLARLPRDEQKKVLATLPAKTGKKAEQAAAKAIDTGDGRTAEQRHKLRSRAEVVGAARRLANIEDTDTEQTHLKQNGTIAAHFVQVRGRHSRCR